MEVQYVYGMRRSGYVACEGLVDVVPDLTNTFSDLAITKERLSEAEERENDLTYLGNIEE